MDARPGLGVVKRKMFVINSKYPVGECLEFLQTFDTRVPVHPEGVARIGDTGNPQKSEWLLNPS